MFSSTRAVSTAIIALALFIAPQAQAARSNPSAVVATQGGATVTLGDIDAYADARIPVSDQAGFFDSPQRIETLITNMLVDKQLAAEARKLGLDRDPEVARELEHATDPVAVLSRVRMEKLRAGIKLPDFSELAQEEYLGHKERYVEHGRIDVKQILISTKSHGEEGARSLAMTVIHDAHAKPDQFDALIEKYSDDPDKKGKHGLLTNVGSGNIDPALGAAAAALKKPGDISPMVKTSLGFHILKLVARAPDRQKGFDEVKTSILAKLRSDYIAKTVGMHTAELRSKKLDANPGIVASLRTRYARPPGKSAAAGQPAKK